MRKGRAWAEMPLVPFHRRQSTLCIEQMSGYINTEETSMFLPLNSQMNDTLPPYTLAICVHSFSKRGTLVIAIHWSFVGELKE